MELKQTQRESLKRANFIFDKTSLNFNKCSKIASIYHNKAFDFSVINYKKVKELNYIIDDFISDINKERGFNSLVNLCMLYKINFFETFDILFFLYVSTTQVLNKNLMEDNPALNEALSWTQSDDYYSTLSEYIYNNIIKFLEEDARKEDNKLAFKFLDNNIKQEAIEETFKRVKEHLNNKEAGKTSKLNLTKFLKKNLQEIKDFKIHQEYLMEIFNNPKILSRLYTRSNPHFMNKLSNDNISYCKETDSFYFEKLERSLIIGYSEQSLLINIDKSQALKGLNKLLENFELLTTDESKETKEYVETMIKLINEEKYSNYLPFKRIGKALGMSKNEARNYAKKILNSVNPNVFDKYYED